LQQFLLLQTRGSSHSRQTIKALASKMADVGTADPEALAAGLALLMSMDMREALSNLACPCLLLMGDRDSLVPEKMLDDALILNSNLVSHVIKGAGHAPFISHTADCGQVLNRCLGQANV
jgi:pimeloyl-[acyl-carrier protein] methyl ester esterase